jgi:hypothetical protein
MLRRVDSTVRIILETGDTYEGDDCYRCTETDRVFFFRTTREAHTRMPTTTNSVESLLTLPGVKFDATTLI